MIRKSYKVLGMHCPSCALVIESDLEDAGVKARCNYARETLDMEYDESRVSEEHIMSVVRTSGYDLSPRSLA